MWCPEILFSRILYMGPVLYPKEIYGIVSYLIFPCKFTLLLKKLWHVGHKRIICGSHPDCYVGQWVNKCNPLSTLLSSATSHSQHFNETFLNGQSFCLLILYFCTPLHGFAFYSLTYPLCLFPSYLSHAFIYFNETFTLCTYLLQVKQHM